MSLTFNSITPNFPSNSFNPSEVILFQLKDLGYIYKKASFFITGDLVLVGTNANAPLTNQKVYYDGFAGIHSFINRITTTATGKGNVIENNSNYALYQKVKSQGSQFLYSHANDSDTSRELKTGDYLLTQKILQGLRTTTGTNLYGANNNETRNKFTFFPDFCLNNSTSDFPSSFTGNIEIELQLQQVNKVLFGLNSGDFTFRFENLTLNYKTYVPAQMPALKELTFTTVSWFTQNCSSNSVISVVNNDPVISSYLVFTDSTKQNDLVSNKLDLALLPEVQQIVYTLNSAQSYFNFPLTNEEEILYHAIRAITLGNFSESSFVYDFAQKQGYAIGLLLPALSDLSQSPLQFLITSASTQANNYLANVFKIAQRTI